LIYYVDQETGWGKIGAVIDSGTSNEGGNIHLADSVDIGTIPVDDDENDEAKIWLILSDDYTGMQMIAWNQPDYLFEHNLITYTKVV